MRNIATALIGLPAFLSLISAGNEAGVSPQAEPTQAAPVEETAELEPAPAEPLPTPAAELEPAPAEPLPTPAAELEPAPAEPLPTPAAELEPAPAEPLPTPTTELEPAPAEPLPTPAAELEPAPVEPLPAPTPEPEPTPATTEPPPSAPVSSLPTNSTQQPPAPQDEQASAGGFSALSPLLLLPFGLGCTLLGAAASWVLARKRRQTTLNTMNDPSSSYESNQVYADGEQTTPTPSHNAVPPTDAAVPQREEEEEKKKSSEQPSAPASRATRKTHPWVNTVARSTPAPGTPLADSCPQTEPTQDTVADSCPQTSMDAPGSPAPPAPAPVLPAPAPASWSATSLPPVLQQPYPAMSKEGPLELEEQEDIIRQACEDPAFARLCQLFRTGSDRAAQRAFMREVAEEYLAKMGRPCGEKSCNSELLRAEENDNFWFIGDVHGCLDALLRLYAYALHASKQQGGRHRIILLGDLLDRGMHSLETLALILHLVMHPLGPELVVLRGNHDDGLRLRDGRFSSYVLPAEVVDELNFMLAHEDAQLRSLGQLMGEAAIRQAELAPVMCELIGLNPQCPEHTLLCTHGGVPHTDCVDALRAREPQGCTDPEASTKPYLATLPSDELRAQFAVDYTWIRLVAELPRKRPNRGSKGCQMGTVDVNTYRLQHWERCGRAVSCIIRGHDHESAGWSLYSYDAVLNPSAAMFVQKNCGVLTINAMDPDFSSSGLFVRRDLALAHCAVGTPMSVIILKGIPPTA